MAAADLSWESWPSVKVEAVEAEMAACWRGEEAAAVTPSSQAVAEALFYRSVYSCHPVRYI